MTRKQNQKVFRSKLKKTPPHPYLCMLLLLIAVVVAAVVVIVAEAAVAVVIVVISLLFGLFTDKMTPFTNS